MATKRNLINSEFEPTSAGVEKSLRAFGGKKANQSSLAGIVTDALPDSPELRREREPAQVSGLTVGGKPVEDVPFGDAIPYANTDQGIEERLARPHAVSSMGRSERPRPVHEGGDFGKTLDARVAAGMDLEAWDAPDPYKEAIDAHCPPGFRAKFLSDAVVRNRGMRGWKYHKPGGDHITVAGMKMGIMPEERAIARNKHFQSAGAEALKQTQEQHDTELERFQRDQGVPGPRRARAGQLDPAGGLQETRETILR